MKKRHYISFNIPKEEGDRVRALLARVGCDHWWQPPPNERGLPSFEHLFDSEDARLHAVIELARREGIHCFERIDHKYTDAELRTYPLVCLTVNRISLDDGGPGRGTTYDLSQACQRCGTGAIQTSPLLLGRTGLPKKGQLCEARDGEILLAERLSQELRTCEVTGLELRQAHWYRNDQPLPWWQMISTHDMPKMSAQTKGIIRGDPAPCPLCRRDGHYHTVKHPPEITYNRHEADAEALPDVVHTWECFGKSRIHEDFKYSRFAPPLLLVKQKVFEIIRKLKVREAGFEPVWFVDEGASRT